MTRRRVTVMVAAMAMTGLLLGACGTGGDTRGDTVMPDDTVAPDDTVTPDDTVAPDDTTDQLPGYGEGDFEMPDESTPVVQLLVQGLFLVVQPFLPTGWTTIYADGTVLLPSRADAFAQPQVWPYEVGHLDPADVSALLLHAQGYGLLEEPDGPSAAPAGVADPPTTTLVLTTAAGSVTHVAVGLGLGDDPTDGYRGWLMKIVGEISDLVMRSAGAPTDGSAWPVFYEPVALDVLAVDVTDADTGQGTNTVIAWDGGADLASWTSCTTVDDPATVAFLVGQLAGPKFQQGDRLYRIASRVHPPGTTCD